MAEGQTSEGHRIICATEGAGAIRGIQRKAVLEVRGASSGQVRTTGAHGRRSHRAIRDQTKRLLEGGAVTDSLNRSRIWQVRVRETHRSRLVTAKKGCASVFPGTTARQHSREFLIRRVVSSQEVQSDLSWRAGSRCGPQKLYQACL